MAKSFLLRRGRLCLFLTLGLQFSSTARADEPERSVVSPTRLKQASYFLAGAGGAFVAHELGHIIANFAFENIPHLSGFYSFGYIPFFAIEPRIYCSGRDCERYDGQNFGPGRGGKYAIVTAGFDMQHITSEVILSHTPTLASKHAPFRKGWLLFNVALSLGYALTSVLKIEDAHGDASGAGELAQMTPWAFAPLLVLPAALDTYRYFSPDNQIAPWLSRGVKVAMFGVAFSL